MTTITATADQATGSVLLEISKTATVHKVLRSNENGIAEVRGLAGQFPSPGTGKLIVSDYEAAVGMNSYTVQTADGEAAAAAWLEFPLPWLMVPVMPHYARQVETITGYNSERESKGTVHDVPGRRDPVANLAPLGLRKGRLELWAKTYADARNIESVFDRGEVAMLKQRVPGLDMYFTATSTAIDPQSVEGEALTRWKLSVSYVEVARPGGALAGALGWTWDALAAAFDTWDAVAASYASWDDLTVDRRRA